MNGATVAECHRLKLLGFTGSQIIALIIYRDELIDAGCIRNPLAAPQTLARRLGLPEPRKEERPDGQPRNL